MSFVLVLFLTEAILSSAKCCVLGPAAAITVERNGIEKNMRFVAAFGREKNRFENRKSAFFGCTK